MKKKEVKKLLKENPEFEAWVVEDSMRVRAVRSNPGMAEELFKRWNDRKRGRLDFDNISQKTKRASEMLTGVQSIMDMMADYTKKL
ncbi:MULTISPECIES: hypothetical protein [Brevibacillus]|jgi:hypothetical protein|uniref:Uncharacterized protein n=1 Tax=Brevibacillus parabrevis TaxID=54914 RepID=A0A4Y3PWB5_BREPA|nr:MULTISPECIES: hypothetical protein [Brevibacillus]TGV08439.1 hypothetical protein EN829_051735 [Mesorhizobium sp. M00.F.Ca.ET.186.01.1.1]KZE40872.1 hypothetical protein AV540_03165 [Brevibacillus parabrevis]MBU8710958.1 hypothetical protein [Brevibacillus parabrevis]MDH6351813.1 hypothetical protein [Brevibacillus sp. 1238]MDR5002097.1 hypothetical protein [Brevibacillus parabrevis]